MASITVRQIDESMKKRLRIRAANHGRSMEGEIREILSVALSDERPEQPNLYESIRRRFAAIGGVELLDVARGPMREPPAFDK